MSDLTDFLLARIAEDEKEASGYLAEMTENPPSVYDMVQVGWIDAGSPDRVLAECKAKRRIVEAFSEESVRRDIYNRDYDSGEYDFNADDMRARLASNAKCRGLEVALLALARPYADHPDYREEWRP